MRFLFCDCSAESPSGRRSLCYDEQARTSRTANAPEGSAVRVAEAMESTLLTEDEYFQLQRVGEFDTKTSSWLRTPAELRGRGGALFGDRRYGTRVRLSQRRPVVLRVARISGDAAGVRSAAPARADPRHRRCFSRGNSSSRISMNTTSCSTPSRGTALRRRPISRNPSFR
jgi:hypothetical protein